MINCSCKEYSTGAIIEGIIRNLSERYEFYCFAEIGERRKFDGKHEFLITPYWLLWIHCKIAQATGLYFWFGIFPTWKLIRRLKKIKPDILHLHCPNMGTLQLPLLLKYAAKSCIPVMMTNHCEVFYTAGCWYSDECSEFVDGCNHCRQRKGHGKLDLARMEWNILWNCYKSLDKHTMVAVSPWQRERMDIAKLAQNARRVTIMNGIDADVFQERSDVEQQVFREHILREAGQRYAHVVLHVTSSFSLDEHDLKGGRYIVALAEKMENLLFLVVGSSNIADRLSLPANVRLMGFTADQRELAGYYSTANLTILTSRKETFGMVCAESLCCGTPVVGFRNGGSESVADEKYSSFVPYGDVDALMAEIEKWLDYKRLHPAFGEGERVLYGMGTMAEMYEEEYERLLDDEGDIGMGWQQR